MTVMRTVADRQEEAPNEKLQRKLNKKDSPQQKEYIPNFVLMDSSNEKEAGGDHQRNINNSGTPLSTEKMELVLDSLYNNPSSPAAFAGVSALWKEARKKIKDLRRKDVQNYLEGHRTYTLMRPRRVRFPRAKTVAAGFMTDVQVDLADFQTLSRHNRGHRYLLVAIDVLSKRLFVVPLRNKRAEEMLEAFKQLIEQMPMVPHRIFSDKGTEFKNRLLKEYFAEQEIEKHEPNHSSVKASIAERAIRNVKQRLYRYFAQKENLNWVDVVQKIVDGINRSPSRVHGMRPIDINFQNAQQVWKRMYGKQAGSKRQRFHKDEFVRMSREKGQFEKGYLPNYGDEILEVDEVLKKVRPVRYKLRDDKGEKFKGSFYQQELVRVRKDAETSYRIEKVACNSKCNTNTNYSKTNPSRTGACKTKDNTDPTTTATTLSACKTKDNTDTTTTATTLSACKTKDNTDPITTPSACKTKDNIDTTTTTNTTTINTTTPTSSTNIATTPTTTTPTTNTSTNTSTNYSKSNTSCKASPNTTSNRDTDYKPTSSRLEQKQPSVSVEDLILDPRTGIAYHKDAYKAMQEQAKKPLSTYNLKRLIDSVKIEYLDNLQRFRVIFKERSISHLSFSPQLGYVLGFQDPQNVQGNEIAKYGCDLRGGFSSFAVYSKGLTENMIIGNSLSSLLRVVSVSGATPGEYNENIYDSPIFAKVLPREINEIEIELRTMDKGRLVPFAYGTTLIVLIFKKMVHIVFDPSIVGYDEYVQTGGGLAENEDYFKGSSPFQRGYGIQRGAGVGDVFRGLWRFFLPILRRVGTTVGAEALNTGQRVLERVGNEGVPLKEAFVTEGKRGIDTVLEKGGLPKQFGKEFRIRKENTSGQLINLEADDQAVCPIQMIGQTFIRNIRMSINGREIFNTNSLMAYKTYFSHELSYSTTAKDSHLQAAGYYRDPGLTLEDGPGCVARRNLFAGSKTAQFIAKIDADLFNQPLYLINFCELDVEILPNDNEFVLIGLNAPVRYRFEVTGLKMYVKKVSLMDGLALDIARKLEMKPARYAVRKTMMKSMFISQGRFEFTSNIFMDQIPRRIILGLVANDDYVGTSARSPFNFQPFNVREISIVANGRSYPQAPYDLDYPNKKYVRAFNDMNEAVGFTNTTESNGITFEQYGQTHCIYVFNMTSSGDDQAGMFDLIKNGTTAVCIKFSQAVPLGGIMMVVMGECDALVMLDKNRSISTDTTI
uniref:Integrase catalytic domain-containing protein n=1 Tax=Globodera rostochiensis TaxID=31243 RepID=A0A914GUJ9_GLORO